MKEILKNYLTKELEKYNSILSNNGLSDEDKAQIENAINNLNETMEALDAANEDNAAIDELRNTIEELSASLTAIKEKINQNKQEKTEIEMENYLSTKNAVKDFAASVRNSKNGEEFQKAWRENLSTNGIAIEAGSEYAYLPQDVRSQIQDLWDRNADWIKDIKMIPAKRYTCRYNVSEQDAETSRAKGWKRGERKVEQEITFAAKQVIPQFIYKLIQIDVQTAFEDDGSLISYIVREMVDQILYEEKRAILIGDGRADSDPLKITSIEAILKDTTDEYTLVSTATSAFLVDDLRAMVDSLHNPNNERVYVFMNKADIRTVSRVQASKNSTPVYMGLDYVAEQIGADRIIPTDLLGEDAKAIAMIPSKYVLIGENVFNPTLFVQHDIWTNSDVYRYECVVGGAIEGKKSTAVLLPSTESESEDENNG